MCGAAASATPLRITRAAARRQPPLDRYRTTIAREMSSSAEEKGGSKSGAKCFGGFADRHNGITVDSTVEPCQAAAFLERLEASVNRWLKEKRRTVWFRVDLSHSELIPILTKNNFKFHHAKEQYVTLYRWLPEDIECNVPPYAHTLLGVGAFVYKEDTNEILVVKENYIGLTPRWKLPGGYVEPGEDIATAAEREVLEETGVRAKFKNLVAFRHGHQFAFGCSDIYMIACLTPSTTDIKKCDHEISECTWMKLDEYVRHPEVHGMNHTLGRKFLEHLEHRKALAAERSEHPISKKAMSIYSIAHDYTRS